MPATQWEIQTCHAPPSIGDNSLGSLLHHLKKTKTATSYNTATTVTTPATTVTTPATTVTTPATSKSVISISRTLAHVLVGDTLGADVHYLSSTATGEVGIEHVHVFLELLVCVATERLATLDQHSFGVWVMKAHHRKPVAMPKSSHLFVCLFGW